MFPLGTVLFPGMVMPLQVFEPRYKVMVAEVLAGDGEFGVVLIERGSEVGGGDTRFDVGCRARVIETRATDDGRFLLAAVGTGRIRIEQWLDDDPYPRALVTDVVDDGPAPSGPGGDDSGGSGADFVTMDAIRRRVDELVGILAPDRVGTLQLPNEPSVFVDAVAGAFGFGALDAQRLLATRGVGARLDVLGELVDDALVVARLRRGDTEAQ